MHPVAFIRRTNRKYRQFVNWAVTAILLALTAFYITTNQTIVNREEVQKIKQEYTSYIDTLVARQDSLYNEIDKLKVGLSDASIRTYQINTASTIIKNLRKEYSETEALKLAALIYDEAERADISYAYGLAVITTESRFNINAVSNVGARGLMQVMPSTFASIARINGYAYDESDISDLRKNTRIGFLYLSRLKKLYGRIQLMSAGYNGGPKVAARYKLYMAGDTSVYIPNETLAYVKAVEKYYYQYKRELGE